MIGQNSCQCVHSNNDNDIRITVVVHCLVEGTVQWGGWAHSRACILWLRPFQVLCESSATIGFVPVSRNGPTSVVNLSHLFS